MGSAMAIHEVLQLTYPPLLSSKSRSMAKISARLRHTGVRPLSAQRVLRTIEGLAFLSNDCLRNSKLWLDNRS